MGGAYWLSYAEHNIKSDVEAAKIVFQSGIPITAVGLDLTLRVWLNQQDLERISQLGNGLGAMLEGQIRAWWNFIHSARNNPHDPLAALVMVRPELFRFESFDVEIGEDHETVAYSRLVPSIKGDTMIASDVLVRTAEKEIIDRITA
jgi:purine nucleosidase